VDKATNEQSHSGLQSLTGFSQYRGAITDNTPQVDFELFVRKDAVDHGRKRWRMETK